MNILHITPYYAPAYAFGGVTRAVEGLARALAARGHAIHILTTDAYTQTARLPPTAPLPDSTIPVTRVRNLSVPLRGRYNLSTPFGMRRAARHLIASADVIHAHEFRTIENLLTFPLADHKPIVLSPHGTLSTDAGRGAVKRVWDRLFSVGMARRIAAVIALTESERADAQALWRAWGASARIEVIPNGVHLPEFEAFAPTTTLRAAYWMRAQFCAAFDLSPDAPLVLYMGRLHPRKGIDALVRGFYAANLPDARLALVGPDDGALDAIRPLLDARAVVTGYLEGALRGGALAAASLFALPSSGGEGLSMAALEAMAAGLPVVLSPACNLPEVEAAGAGMIVDATPDALAGAFRAIIGDADRRRAMGAAARALVEEKFTWERVAALYETVYGRVTAIRKSSVPPA
jgi:glycosyltransferase involved in cell wall biosynthesis